MYLLLAFLLNNFQTAVFALAQINISYDNGYIKSKAFDNKLENQLDRNFFKNAKKKSSNDEIPSFQPIIKYTKQYENYFGNQE